jgi:hypothetical protein
LAREGEQGGVAVQIPELGLERGNPLGQSIAFIGELVPLGD